MPLVITLGKNPINFFEPKKISFGHFKQTFIFSCLSISHNLIPKDKLNGIPVENLSDDELAEIRNQKLGFVFQQFHLLSDATALENVTLPMIYAGIEPEQRLERGKNALKKVGLSERMNNRPNQLSGGQQQRVAIARAIINNPAILLADEPTGALDSKTTEDVLDLFDKLHESGITIVLVTHEDEVANRAKKIAKFKDGRIIELKGN